MADEHSDASWIQHVRQRCAAAPYEIEPFLQVVCSIRSSLDTEIIHALVRRLESALQEMPADSLENKRAMAALVNNSTRACGLAMRCPKTGLPARVYADYPVEAGRDSRFRLEVVDANGHRARTYTSREFPPLSLRSAAVAVSRDHSNEWRRR